MKTNNNDYQSFLATANRKYFNVGLAGAFLFCIGAIQLPLHSKTIMAATITPPTDEIFTITYVPEIIERKVELPKEAPPLPKIITPITNIVTTPEKVVERIETPTPLVITDKGTIEFVAPVAPPTPETSTFVKVAQVMPKFGKDELDIFNYITKNIRYEKEMVDFEGKVYVRFIVGKDGKVTDVEIAKGAYAILDKEALRVIKNMPAWTPGSQNGEAVNVQMVIPINFVAKS